MLRAGVTSNGLTCDPDGVNINWGLETNDNSVRTARIAGIDKGLRGSRPVIRTNQPDASAAGLEDRGHRHGDVDLQPEPGRD